jgi:hypothetical protein
MALPIECVTLLHQLLELVLNTRTLVLSRLVISRLIICRLVLCGLLFVIGGGVTGARLKLLLTYLVSKALE